MARELPAITGQQLIRLFRRDGWEIRRQRSSHVVLAKLGDGRRRVAVIPDKRSPLPAGTLSGILGPRQSGIGREGLEELLDRYG
jgi:predicted RNA binding protein YcfA (HicA-like mRNA interferase family)